MECVSCSIYTGRRCTLMQVHAPPPVLTRGLCCALVLWLSTCCFTIFTLCYFCPCPSLVLAAVVWLWLSVQNGQLTGRSQMVYGVDLDTIWRGFQSQVLLQLESLPSQKLKPQLESGGVNHKLFLFNSMAPDPVSILLNRSAKSEGSQKKTTVVTSSGCSWKWLTRYQHGSSDRKVDVFVSLTETPNLA